jgi:hypothetical protein
MTRYLGVTSFVSALMAGCSTTDTVPVDTGGAGGSSGSGGAVVGGSSGSGVVVVGGSSGSGGAVVGGSSGSGGAVPEASAGTDGSGSEASAGSGGSGPDASADGDGGNCVALTVKNYLSWCSVSVGGRTASSGAAQTVCVAPGAVSLSATPLTGFKLGTAPWHGTNGDTGSGELGTVVAQASTATVTVSAAKCVWVCCEFAAGGGCAVPDQCP